MDTEFAKVSTTFKEDSKSSEWRSSSEEEVHNKPGHQNDCEISWIAQNGCKE